MPPHTLFVDDDPGVCDTVRRRAERKGVEGLVIVNSWEEGLARFFALAPRLVIADYNLPGSEHGLKLLWRIRRLEPSVRIVLFTGELNEPQVDRLNAMNVIDRALLKGTDGLRAVIEEILAAQTRQEERTDWQAFGQAFVATLDIDDDSLTRLDGELSRAFQSGS